METKPPDMIRNPELKSIIICDTQLYRPEEIARAKAPSVQYYNNLGFARMDANYHDHCAEFLSFDFEYLYRSRKGLVGKLLGRPFFPIISIKRPA